MVANSMPTPRPPAVPRGSISHMPSPPNSVARIGMIGTSVKMSGCSLTGRGLAHFSGRVPVSLAQNGKPKNVPVPFAIP